MIIYLIMSIACIIVVSLILYILYQGVKRLCDNMNFKNRFKVYGYGKVTIDDREDSKFINTSSTLVSSIEQKESTYYYHLQFPYTFVASSEPLLTVVELENLLYRFKPLIDDMSQYCNIEHIHYDECTIIHTDKYRVKVFEDTICLSFTNVYAPIEGYLAYTGDFRDNISMLEKHVDFFYEDVFAYINDTKEINGFKLSFIETSIIASKKVEYFNINYMFDIKIEDNKIYVYRDDIVVNTLPMHSFNGVIHLLYAYLDDNEAE